MSGLHLSIAGRTDRPEDGGDSLAMFVPARWYVISGGHKVMLMQTVMRELTAQAWQFAEDAGKLLHHAMFVFTDDPAEVREHIPLCKCGKHVAEVDQAVAALNDPANAGREMVVGQLYWAEQD